MTTDADLPIPGHGVTLVTGPSNAGKTRLTARALAAWLTRAGPAGTVVFEFGPAVERDGRLLGGRLTRVIEIPSETWCGTLDAHAPRAEADCDADAVELAATNAANAAALFDAAPPRPRAVFVNDATIAFQHPDGDPERLVDYCAGADLVVCNAFESEELGVDDPVSRQERAALDALNQFADHRVRLD